MAEKPEYKQKIDELHSIYLGSIKDPDTSHDISKRILLQELKLQPHIKNTSFRRQRWLIPQDEPFINELLDQGLIDLIPGSSKYFRGHTQYSIQITPKGEGCLKQNNTAIHSLEEEIIITTSGKRHSHNSSHTNLPIPYQPYEIVPYQNRLS
ncbi:MAG: hypothetical protein ACOCQX_03140 [Candidatus Nanoarchaeia archaeon]